jgi:hypothetical protein
MNSPLVISFKKLKYNNTMAIHTQQANQVEGGFQKTIDEGSMRMVLDNLQRTQYQYPYKSTVRELVSNSIDAIRERETALSILTGKTKVEDHFVVIEGSEYKDSKFDPSYYDQQWLSDDPTIYITYKEGSMLEKDRLIIRDNGVGLAGKRLVGYFSLAFSTKRLSKFGLGKYGIGAKAALSTGAPYYTVKNRHNGKETWWNVYPYQVEPIIPRWDMPSPSIRGDIPAENPLMTLENGSTCYYKNTSEKNGLEIILEVKKHHKQQYIDAVKSQLLYFDNILFRIEAANGVIDTIPVKADVLYEDEIMILSDNKMYSKPHILINRVNYGNIDFVELELEDKIGNISIKMKPEEVSVSPSREHVLWDEMTRNSVVNRFKEVQAVSEGLLQKELNQSDFMKWLKACILVKNKIGTEQADGLVARLAKLVDLSNYTPVYKPDPQFKLDRNLFAGIKVRKITGKTERHGSSYRMKVDRTQAGLSDLANGDLPVLIQQEDTSWLRDRYLLEEIFTDGFITILLNETEIKRPSADALPNVSDSEDFAEKLYQMRKTALLHHARDTAAELKWYDPKFDDETGMAAVNVKALEAAERVLVRWKKLNEYILSSEGLQHYSSFTVPADYGEKHKEQDEDAAIKKEDEVQTKEARLSAEARRKLHGKTILFTPRVRSWLGNSADFLYEWHKLEIPVAEIDEWNNPEVFYSSEDNASLLQLAACITRPGQTLNEKIHWEEEEEHILNIPTSNPPVTKKEWKERESYLTAYDGNPAVKLVKVAKDKVKYYRDFKYIHEFFAQVHTKTKTITMSNALIRWNTARYIHEQLPKLRFLANFKPFHEEYSNLYNSMKNYCEQYYREVGEYTGKYKELVKVEYDDMIRHLDKVTELQVFVREHPEDSQAIANLVRELFGTGLENTVTDGCGIDMNIRDIIHKLLDYAEPIQVMLNQIPILTGEYDQDETVLQKHYTFTEELETEIRNYIEFKKAGL